MNIREYLHEKGFEFKEVKRKNGLNAVFVCPFCGGGPKKDITFAINFETGAWNCLRANNCGLTGTFQQFQEKLGDIPKKEPFIKSKNYKSKSFTIPKVTTKPLSEKSLNYLHNRGLTDETIQQFKLFQSSTGEIAFPFFKGSNQVNVKYRTLDKKFRQETGAERCLYNRDSVQGDILTIAEGEIDCISLVQYGFHNVVSIPCGTKDMEWIENEWDWLEKFKTIYLAMDNDKAGGDAINVLIERLGRWRCSSVIFPYKDVNDCLKAGISKEKMAEGFQNAKEFPPATLKNAGAFYEEVAEMFADPDKFKGIDTGFPGLNIYLQGWRDGELTIWSGNNSAGKSTLLNQVMLNLAAQRIRSCIASFELRPARYLKWATSQAIGKEQPNPTEIMDAFAWFDQWLFVVNTTKGVTPAEILEVFEYAARKYGVKHFFIDSLMKMNLSKGSDKYDAQSGFVAQLSDFAKKYQGHVHLVAHPRKGQTDSHKPDKVDVGGSGDITNLPDNVLVVWRLEDEVKKMGEPDAVLYIKKNREYGKTGATKLYFNTANRRFSNENQIIDYHFNGIPF